MGRVLMTRVTLSRKQNDPGVSTFIDFSVVSKLKDLLRLAGGTFRIRCDEVQIKGYAAFKEHLHMGRKNPGDPDEARYYDGQASSSERRRRERCSGADEEHESSVETEEDKIDT